MKRSIPSFTDLLVSDPDRLADSNWKRITNREWGPAVEYSISPKPTLIGPLLVLIYIRSGSVSCTITNLRDGLLYSELSLNYAVSAFPFLT